MAKTVKTSPIIQCSLPLGKWAKGNTPMSTRKRWPRNTVNKLRAVTHWGLAGASRGTNSVPLLTGQVGRRQFLSQQMHLHVHEWPCTQTHPKTNPLLQPSQLQACRAGEGGGQGPRSGWQGKPSQDHNEQKSCPKHIGYFNWK